MVVVDPGVGTDRGILAAKTGSAWLIAPDNGLITLAARVSPPSELIELDNRQYWGATISPTFHGRDIMAPVAAHLAVRQTLAGLGRPRDRFCQLEWPGPVVDERGIRGEVVSFDSFGNALTDIAAEMLPVDDSQSARIRCGGCTLIGVAATYRDLPRSPGWQSGGLGWVQFVPGNRGSRRKCRAAAWNLRRPAHRSQLVRQWGGDLAAFASTRTMCLR